MDFINLYSPVWAFHPDERHFPLPVQAYVRECRLTLSDGTLAKGDWEEWVTATNPGEQINTTLVPIDGPRAQFMYAGLTPDAPVYVGLYAPTPKDTYLTYYLFYGVNPALPTICGCACCGFHWADIEHIQVHIHEGKLERVYYSKHGGGNWVAAKDVVFSQDTHPMVYVSQNSHACYEQPGFKWRFGVIVPDWASVRGPRMKSESIEMIAGPLLYRGTYGDNHVSGFPLNSGWEQVESDRPYLC